jgi:rubrerythrin
MDIYEFAMEKEKYSETYYRQLAGKTKFAGLKNILTMLADEEVKHCNTVSLMKAGTPPTTVTETPVLADAERAFEKMRVSAEKFRFDISEAELYRKACDIERESKRYYLQKTREVEDQAQKDIFLRLAEDENKHLLLVERLCDFVARPQTFLENAEMYHFDDYVEGVF